MVKTPLLHSGNSEFDLHQRSRAGHEHLRGPIMQQETRKLAVVLRSGLMKRTGIALKDEKGKILSCYWINLPQEFSNKISFREQKNAGGPNVYHYLESYVPGQGHASELLRRLRRVFEVLAGVRGKPVEHVVNTTITKLAPDYEFEPGLNIGRKLFAAGSHVLMPDEQEVLELFVQHLRDEARKN